jgi:hypothetical protein
MGLNYTDGLAYSASASDRHLLDGLVCFFKVGGPC